MSTLRKSLPVAVAMGDGIGPEIMTACLNVFKAAKVPLDYHVIEMGKEVYLRGRSDGMTPEARKTVESFGILYKGPMETPKGAGVKSINVTARKVWNTFANKRVFRTYPGVETIFSKAKIPIDITLLRENIEDTYGGIEHMQTHDVAQCRRLITRPGSLQVHRYAFQMADRRQSRRVTCAHKANIMKLTDGLFLKTFYEVAKEFPHIKADDIIVDDLAMKLVMQPQNFDVVILPNLQGDIISDMCAGLVGGLGMAPSANIGERISIFEAVHGTAPDIVGKKLANPMALMISGVMMLRHLGLYEHGDAIHDAMVAVLEKGYRTKDLAGPTKPFLHTDEFADAIIDHLPSTDKFVVKDLPQPPIAPKENIVHVSPLTKEKKNVGIDLFLDVDATPKQLAEDLQKLIPEEYKLTMLSNRGTQVWPTGSLFTECVNYYRARVELREKPEEWPEEEELLEIAKNIAKEYRICSIEMLLQIGDERGYTLAQGQ